MIRRNRTIAGVLLILLVGVGSAILIFRGQTTDPEEQQAAMRLHLLHGWWVESGSPEPPQIERYVTYSPPSTGFVYSASHNIDGRAHQGLFAYRDGIKDRTFIVDRGGEIFVLDRNGRTRLVKLEPEGQPRKPSLLARIKRRLLK